MTGHYFNEFDPKAAAWLRELIKANLIPAGDVDERSIKDVAANDLRGFGSCHFFAGIGGWPYALRLANWPDARPVWTGSCPCQPYSAAGKQKGDADARNLWPDFFRLIRECRPECVFGEQVEGAIRHGWLDGICADLEGEGYAVGSCVLGAHSVGAPHIRQRLFWVADAAFRGTGQHRDGPGIPPREAGQDGERGCGTRIVADADGGFPGDDRLQRGGEHGQQPEDGGTGRGLGDPNGSREITVGGVPRGAAVERAGSAGGLGDADGAGPQPGRVAAATDGHGGAALADGRSFWDAYDLIPCRDDKARRVEPGTFPLATGVSGRVGLLRGYGNSIVPQTAAAFVRAFMELHG